MCYCMSLGAFMLIFAVLALWNNVKNSQFEWVRFMFLLCIGQDIVTFYLYFVLLKAESPGCIDGHPEAISIQVGIFVGLYFLFNNLIYWFYGFKYWVIAIEVPGVYNKDESRCKLSKSTYNFINYTVVALNILVCSWLVYERGALAYAICTHEPQSNLKITETLEESANGFLILDAIFLADALRRLKKEFAKNQKFEENKQVMYLHMFIIIGHCFVMVASAIVMS